MAKAKTKATFGFLLLTIIVVAIVFLNESAILTDPTLQIQFQRSIYLYGVLGLFLLILFLILFNKRKDLINYKAILFISLAFMTSLVAVFMHPNVISFLATHQDGSIHPVSFSLGLFLRFQSVFYTLTSAFVTYVLFVLAPKLVPSKSFLIGFLYCIIVLFLILGFLSFIKDWPKYDIIFKTGDLSKSSPTMSVFSNPNVFGYYMSVAIFLCGIVDALNHTFINYLLMVIFFFFLFFTISLTAYVGAILFIILYVIYDTITQLKANKVRTVIWVTISSVVIFTIIMGLMLSNKPFAMSVRNYLIPQIRTSFISRYTIWSHARDLLYGIHLWIGHGVIISHSLLKTGLLIDYPTATNRFHNGWYDIVATGGLIGLAFYLISIGYIVYLVIKKTKYNSKLYLIILFTLIGVLAQSITEAKVLFRADSMGTLVTFIITVPLLLDTKLVDVRPVIRPLPRMFSLDHH